MTLPLPSKYLEDPRVQQNFDEIALHLPVSLANSSFDSVGWAAGSFSAHMGSNQSISNATFTKVNFDGEDWDMNGWYDTTNKRFTPLTKGIYRITGSGYFTSSMADQSLFLLTCYKNGSDHRRLQSARVSGSSNDEVRNGSCLVSMNGTTDYVEIFVYQSNGAASSYTLGSSGLNSYFQGELVGKLT